MTTPWRLVGFVCFVVERMDSLEWWRRNSIHVHVVSLLLFFSAAVATPGEAYLEIRLPRCYHLHLLHLHEVVELYRCLIDRVAVDADQ